MQTIDTTYYVEVALRVLPWLSLIVLVGIIMHACYTWHYISQSTEQKIQFIQQTAERLSINVVTLVITVMLNATR